MRGSLGSTAFDASFTQEPFGDSNIGETLKWQSSLRPAFPNGIVASIQEVGLFARKEIACAMHRS